jgi:hypothetical protein
MLTRSAQRRNPCAAGGCIGHTGVEKQRLRLAVLDDVADVLGRQVPVDGRETQAGAMGRETYHGELAAVAAHQRHGVAGGETRRAQAPHQAVGLRVQLGEAHRALVRPQRDAPGLHGATALISMPSGARAQASAKTDSATGSLSGELGYALFLECARSLAGITRHHDPGRFLRLAREGFVP